LEDAEMLPLNDAPKAVLSGISEQEDGD